MRIADALLRMLVRGRVGPQISFDDRMLILDRCLRVMRRGARRHESDADWRAFEQARAALVEACTVERLLALAVYRDGELGRAMVQLGEARIDLGQARYELEQSRLEADRCRQEFAELLRAKAITPSSP
jgi:hypothetical protein